MYYYVLEEYRVSNELLTEDIYVSVHSTPLMPPLRTSVLRSLSVVG